MQPFRWICPFCDHAAIITDDSYDENTLEFDKGNIHGVFELSLKFIVCPNPKCREYTLILLRRGLPLLMRKSANGYFPPPDKREVEKRWQLVPPSTAKVFPSSIVPQVILDDYGEACLIKDLSPKASATLSRRCLQGMIRNFHEVIKETLKQEIDAIQNKVEPNTWEAIEAVRTVGNIGAHMEKDINLIIDVEPNEAQLLIELIEILIKDWYIAKHERGEKLEAIKKIAKEKDAKKKEVKKDESL